MLRYYYHIADPDQLDDETWCAYLAEIEWLHKIEQERQKESLPLK